MMSNLDQHHDLKNFQRFTCKKSQSHPNIAAAEKKPATQRHHKAHEFLPGAALKGMIMRMRQPFFSISSASEISLSISELMTGFHQDADAILGYFYVPAGGI